MKSMFTQTPSRPTGSPFPRSPERVRRAVTVAVPPPATLGALFGDPAQLRRLFYMWLFQAPGGVAEAVLAADRRG
jgi:hypothetical protein